VLSEENVRNGNWRVFACYEVVNIFVKKIFSFHISAHYHIRCLQYTSVYHFKVWLVKSCLAPRLHLHHADPPIRLKKLPKSPILEHSDYRIHSLIRQQSDHNWYLWTLYIKTFVSTYLLHIYEIGYYIIRLLKTFTLRGQHFWLNNFNTHKCLISTF